MKYRSLQLFVVISLLFVTVSYAQSYRIQNGLGIYGGLTNFDIITNDFSTKSKSGWHLGLATTVDIPHRWYNVSYNIQLAQNRFGISAAPIASSQSQFIDYEVITAQVALIGHLKLIGNYLTIDAGPMLQYNSSLDLQDASQENYIIDGYNTITAKDLSEISNFNINAIIGTTFGINNFKIRGQYIYGFTNILKKINDQNLQENSDFNGHQSMFVFSAMFIF